MNDRVKELRRALGLSGEKFGANLGVTRSAISDIEKGRNNVSEQMLKLICSVYNVSEQWLRYGIGEMFKKPQDGFWGELKSRYSLTDFQLMAVKKYAELPVEDKAAIDNFIKSLADSGLNSEDTVSEEPQAYEIETVGKVAAGQGYEYATVDDLYKSVTCTDVPRHDFALEVKGDSMSPLIKDGDTVFIKECYDKLPKRIYALDIDGAAVIKRVIWGKDKITLLSENKEYPPRDITGEQLLNTKIIGLVVGWGTPEK